MAVPMAAESRKSLESWIWDAACSIRGAKDAPKYKDYIQPLTKRLCDGFEDERNRLAAEVGSRETACKLAGAEGAKAMIKHGRERGIALLLFVLASLGIGGVTGFAQTFTALVIWLLILVVTGAVVALVIAIGIRLYRRKGAAAPAAFGWQSLHPQPLDPKYRADPQPKAREEPEPKWTRRSCGAAWNG